MANLRQFSYDLQVSIPERFASRQSEIIIRAAEIGAARAAAVAPVDTGRLRDSIHAREVHGGAAFGSDVPYAGFQEFGTRRIRPRRYIQQGYGASLEYLAGWGFKRR